MIANAQPPIPCDNPQCGCSLTRRSALRLITLGTAALGLPKAGRAAESSKNPGLPFLIPADKRLSPEWLRSLVRRDTPTVWWGKELAYIGMPVGGIGCGQLYLAGDGRLWLWDIFKSNYTRESVAGVKFELMTMNGHYTKPVAADGGIYSSRNGAVVGQGFVICIKKPDFFETRKLDSHGFPDVTFRGEYPIGRVTYADRAFPVRIELEAFSPFIPLHAVSSASPATVFAFNVTNVGDDPLEIDLIGLLQNATCPYENDPALGQRHNTLFYQNGCATLECSVEASPGKGLETRHGFGSMALSLIGDHPAGLRGTVEQASQQLRPAIMDHPAGLRGTADATATPMDQPFASGTSVASALGRGPLEGSLGKNFTLAPGASHQVNFILSWYFPRHQQAGDQAGGMNQIKDFSKLSRHYAAWFSSAAGVAQGVAACFDQLAGTTRLWNRTWYDSTLPHWLLDRAIIPVDCLATQTFHWFDSDRLWAWEGVECCEGTCTHVWNYAQAMARLFPELERNLRENTDYGLAFAADGQIGNRAEFETEAATDGQAGTIVRTWREHTMSADDGFLRRVWPKTKKAIEWLIMQDPQQKGVLEGAQSNTLDATWSGPMGWISSLYCAALRAGEQMALEMDDPAFAKTCGEIAGRGSKAMVEQLFNGEYFIHLPPNHDHINTNRGCHIDQVLGQSWACQTGLPRVLPKRETHSALDALWKYNFAPDAGGYAIAHTAIKGHRVYAAPGEAGLVMTTWPQGGDELAVPGMANKHEDFLTWLGPGGYFDECMSGFEYQVAAHMIYEGEPDSERVIHGLAIARAIHDRYAAGKRNPFNEIECGDHYSRAMAAFGVFLAVCGYQYHGPQGRLGFAPRISPDNFKAAFITAEGWGTFTQLAASGKQRAQLSLHQGSLHLRTIALGLVGPRPPSTCVLVVAGKPLAADLTLVTGQAEVRFAEIVLKAGDTLQLELG